MLELLGNITSLMGFFFVAGFVLASTFIKIAGCDYWRGNRRTGFKHYTIAMLLFCISGFVLVFALDGMLPSPTNELNHCVQVEQKAMEDNIQEVNND